MIRFFASPSDISGGYIRLSEEDAAHIRSLRLRPTELFTVCDGEGADHICRLGEHGATVAEIIETRRSRGEPSVSCCVYIALSKGHRLEYAVQKSVELGAAKIVIFSAARCVTVPGNMEKRITRLRRIALETAKQSGRGRIPEITAAESFRLAVEDAARAHLRLFCYEEEEKRSLKEALESGGEICTVSIITGPEGGFEPDEARLAAESGMQTVTLGPRILRCETAPAAVLAAVMLHTGNM